jgi:hypothetical protein
MLPRTLLTSPPPVGCVPPSTPLHLAPRPLPAASLSCLSSIDLHPADSCGTIPAVYLTGTQQHAAATAAAAAAGRPACASPSRWDASLSLFAGATDTDGLSGGGGLHPAMLAALPTADDLAALVSS